MLLGTSVALLNDGEADTLVLGEGDEGFVLIAQDEDVGGQSGPDVATAVADLDDLLRARVGQSGEDDTNAANVAATSGHGEVSNVEFDESNDFAGGQVDLDDVVDADIRVRVADGAAIVGTDVRDSTGKQADLLDAAELESGLLGQHSVEDEASLDVIQQTEVLISAVNLDHVHETSGEGSISANLSVNRDQALHQDQSHLTAGQRILESVTQQDHQRQALTELVRSSAGARSENSAQLVEHPVGRSVQALKVVLGSTRHFRSILIQRSIAIM